MSVLENMKAAGDIDKYQYVELAPDSAIPFKAKIKEMWDNEKNDLLIQAMELIKQYQQTLGINQGGMPNEMQTMSNGNVN